MRGTMVRRVGCGLLTAFIAVQATQTCAGAADQAIGLTVAADSITYRTQPGDTLSSIAGRFTSATDNWAQLGKLNGITRNTSIAVGTAIRIPVPLLADVASQAQVVALFGTVSIGTGDGHFSPLQNGSVVTEGGELRTAANSFLTLALPDGSRVSIPSNSHIKIAKLRTARFTKSPRTVITIVSGNVEAQVSPLQQNQGHFEIKSTLATAGVRGTQFRVGVAPNGATHTELLSGVVELSRNGSAEHSTLHKGEGELVSSTGLGAILPLLAAPELSQATLLPGKNSAQFNLAALGGASAYHVQVATDAEGQNTIAEARAGMPRVLVDGISPGAYFVQISAIDQHGLEGYAQRIPVTLARVAQSSPTVVANGVSAPWIDGSDSRQLRLKWRSPQAGEYQVQVAHDIDFSWLKFNASAQRTEISLPRPPFGTYFVRVRRINPDGLVGPYSAVQSIIVTDQWIIPDGEPRVASSSNLH